MIVVKEGLFWISVYKNRNSGSKTAIYSHSSSSQSSSSQFTASSTLSKHIGRRNSLIITPATSLLSASTINKSLRPEYARMSAYSLFASSPLQFFHCPELHFLQ